MSDRTPNFPRHVVGACAVAAFFMGALRASAGLGLNEFLLPFGFVALFLPPLLGLADSWLRRAALIAAVASPVGVFWLEAWGRSSIDLSAWLACSIVLLVWTAALGAWQALLKNTLRVPSLASTTVSCSALIWLTAPIWLGTAAPPIVHVHPLFAVNLCTQSFGLWPEQPLAYKYLFSLGQDVPYTLPASIWPAVSLHALLAAAAGAVNYLLERKRESSPA